MHLSSEVGKKIPPAGEDLAGGIFSLDERTNKKALVYDVQKLRGIPVPAAWSVVSITLYCVARVGPAHNSPYVAYRISSPSIGVMECDMHSIPRRNLVVGNTLVAVLSKPAALIP